MVRASREPRGHALSPPSSLARRRLPIDAFPAGASWFRCHLATLDPIFFGPAAGSPPRYRFDAPAQEYEVLYLGFSYDAAIVETLFRNPRRHTVDQSDIEARNMAVLTNLTPLRLVRVHGAGLAHLGTTAALSTGGYGAARRWALALWNHSDQPDGLAYVSRHNPGLLSAAIFDRYAERFHTTSVPLVNNPAELARVFDAHGKSIA